MFSDMFYKVWENGLIQMGVVETIYMTVGATVLAYIVGLPLGLVLAATAADGVRPNRGVNLVLGAIVNVLRSVPFLILLYTVIPVTRFVVGTAADAEKGFRGVNEHSARTYAAECFLPCKSHACLRGKVSL